ncbi:MAG: hypothetical protein ABIJ96_17020 [Elusimicrobiota bacterium]
MRTRILLIAAAGLAVAGCRAPVSEAPAETRPRLGQMRTLILELSREAKAAKPGFMIVPQNGLELLTVGGQADSAPAEDYLAALDGVGQQGVFFKDLSDQGIRGFGVREEAARLRLISLLDIVQGRGLRVFVTDYVGSESQVENSRLQNKQKGYSSFRSKSRDLDLLPYPSAGEFLYLLNAQHFQQKEAYLGALRHADYGFLIIDAAYKGEEALTADEVRALKINPSGGARPVLAYLNIGKDGAGGWASYWEPAWQRDVKDRLRRIIDADFDGVYLGGVEAFLNFEEQAPGS